VNRYLAEACYTLPHKPEWALARQAIWYWTRMIVEIVPARIRWWESPAQMNRAPSYWQAAEGLCYPTSDPAPPGRTSPAAKWEEQPWQDLAAQALGRGASGHLSVVDADGFPLPICANRIVPTKTGFALDLPGGVPWTTAGQACLTFGGIETFLGTVERGGEGIIMAVARTLPVFPMTKDMTQLWEPAPHTRAQLMRRLEEELNRRGQPVPIIPEVRPEPSEGYRRRMARMGVTLA
jgi:hypothetical protein